jgi:hypothetical protein
VIVQVPGEQTKVHLSMLSICRYLLFTKLELSHVIISVLPILSQD